MLLDYITVLVLQNYNIVLELLGYTVVLLPLDNSAVLELQSFFTLQRSAVYCSYCGRASDGDVTAGGPRAAAAASRASPWGTAPHSLSRAPLPCP